jgi:hypothetical protein
MAVGGGPEEVAQEGGRVQIDRARQAKQAQRPDPDTTAIGNRWLHHHGDTTGVPEEATKNRGRPFLGPFERGACGLRGRPHPSTRLTFDSPALRVSGGKSGVEGVE